MDDVAAGLDLTVICGRYGGMDERVWTELATEAVSLGDFVLSGGEIVAAALVDAAIRRLHGVLGNEESLIGESFSAEDVVGPPQYTRPADWAGTSVPEVLLSGNHARIHAWRKEEARLRAARRTFLAPLALFGYEVVVEEVAFDAFDLHFRKTGVSEHPARRLLSPRRPQAHAALL